MFGAVNLYIGLRSWQVFGPFFPAGSGRIYCVLIAFFSLSYIAARVGQKWLPESIYTGLTYVGATWMAVVYYGFLFTLLADCLLLLNRFIPIFPPSCKQLPLLAGLTILLLVTGLLTYGFWNARNPVINRYDITINKPAGNRSTLHAVAVSDIHLGNLIGSDRLATLVESINHLKPDIILMVGDVIDAELEPFLEQNMGSVLRRLQAPLGIYAVLGNHEYIGKQTEEIISALGQAGITVLRDTKVTIADSFVLAGRDEYSRNRYSSLHRIPLSNILAGVTPGLPILLLDHQPVNLNEAKEAGVDLQLSGHTHRGQLFPNQLITASIFEVDWGYLKKDSLQVIVSSGYGTWGPPFRVGNRPELLDIYITFGQ